MSSETNHPWPQFFVTRIVENEDLPDVEILTLPRYEASDAVKTIDELAAFLHLYQVEEFEPIGGSGIDYDRRGNPASRCRQSVKAHSSMPH